MILSQEDGMYAAGSVVQASVTGNTGAGFIISVAAGDEVLFGTIDFGSEDPLPVYFYMPDGDVKIVLDGLSAAQIEAGVNEDGEEEIGIPFAGKMLKAAVNSSSLKQHTAADISYINFTSGEKAYFPNGYDAATMKTVVIYYKDGTNSGTRRAFCVDHYMGPPQSANGITNFSEESRMSKLMYFNFGGPGFDLKIGGESVKDIMNASGLTDEHHYQMMSHLILAWQYDGILLRHRAWC